jgi:hypothetical protein
VRTQVRTRTGANLPGSRRDRLVLGTARGLFVLGVGGAQALEPVGENLDVLGATVRPLDLRGVPSLPALRPAPLPPPPPRRRVGVPPDLPRPPCEPRLPRCTSSHERSCAEPTRTARYQSLTSGRGVGSSGGAPPRGMDLLTWAIMDYQAGNEPVLLQVLSCVGAFSPPACRTVHAVLPHTAHRRRSPPAFGLSRQDRFGLGATTVPFRSIRPS